MAYRCLVYRCDNGQRSTTGRTVLVEEDSGTMKARWMCEHCYQQLTGNLNVSGSAVERFGRIEAIESFRVELTKAYMEPHRKYHNLSHIMRMFEVAKEKGIDLSAEQISAIWYHDAIYEISAASGENENRSADLAFRETGSELVRLFITDTILHTPKHWESKVVTDLDLYDLSQPDRYEENRAKIKEEFRSVYTEAQWSAGRTEWLKSMLRRDSIFVSEITTDEEEEQARKLMEWELENFQPFMA